MVVIYIYIYVYIYIYIFVFIIYIYIYLNCVCYILNSYTQLRPQRLLTDRSEPLHHPAPTSGATICMPSPAAESLRSSPQAGRLHSRPAGLAVRQPGRPGYRGGQGSQVVRQPGRPGSLAAGDSQAAVRPQPSCRPAAAEPLPAACDALGRAAPGPASLPINMIKEHRLMSIRHIQELIHINMNMIN